MIAEVHRILVANRTIGAFPVGCRWFGDRCQSRGGHKTRKARGGGGVVFVKRLDYDGPARLLELRCSAATAALWE